MSKLKATIKRSYIFLIIAIFYIPLFMAAVYSFNSTPKRNNMSINFTPDGSGWNDLIGNIDIARGAFASFIIAIVVTIVVVSISLLTVFSIWKSKLKIAKTYLDTTSKIPLINPDVITGVSLSIAFASLFGTLKFLDDGIERAIIGHVVMIVPFGISLMYPRSETFKNSLFEASKDLGYGPVKTWFKTYFRHMIGVILATVLVSVTLSFDDFIITKTTSRVSTIGTQLYQTTKIRPWIFALGTIVLFITLTSSIVYSLFIYLKNRKRSIK